MSLKTNSISTSYFNVQKLSLGGVQNKKSRDGNNYENILIFYDGKKAIVRPSGRFQIKEFDDVSLVVQLDDNNRKLFEEFEKKLRCLAREGSFEVDQRDYIYLIIYTLYEKINAKFWEIFETDGKEYRKPLRNPNNLIDKNFERD